MLQENIDLDGIQAIGRRPEFWPVLMRIIQIAAGIDIAFFFLYYLLGSPILAWINILSVAAYVAAYQAMKVRKTRLARNLILTEIITHAALGTVLIGWDSGFHYFLLMFIPAISLSTSRKGARIALVALFVFYTGLGLLMSLIDPIQPINALALHIVHTFNLSVVFAMFSYLCMYYLKTVRRAQEELHLFATTDPLTNLLNRRHMTHLADKEVGRLDQAVQATGVIVIDVDHFKKINDDFGHDTGDRVLVCAASILKSCVRKQDLISRWGGEEFLVILPDTDTSEALNTAERIRVGFLEYDWHANVNEDVGATVTSGVSKLMRGESLVASIARADEALYRGKANGRNRVETARA
ncbi:MAG: GGDEF domain-containing protein [Congregibacter sp.]